MLHTAAAKLRTGAVRDPISRSPIFYVPASQDVHPPHGQQMLQVNRYKYETHNKRQVAQDVCDALVGAIGDIYGRCV